MPMIYNAIGLSTLWEIENEEDYKLLKDLYPKSLIYNYEGEGEGIYCKFNYLTEVKGTMTSFIQKFSIDEMKAFIEVGNKFKKYIGESDEN